MVKKDLSLGVCGKNHVRTGSLSLQLDGTGTGTIVLIERTGMEVPTQLNGN